MRILRLDELPDRTVDRFGSVGFSLRRLTSEGHVVCAAIAPGGVIGEHPAATDQLLAVVSGDVVASGEDGESARVPPGSAALWIAGERHRSASRDGAVVLVVEAPGLAAALD